MSRANEQGEMSRVKNASKYGKVAEHDKKYTQ
jgi:hypothetical protein